MNKDARLIAPVIFLTFLFGPNLFVVHFSVSYEDGIMVGALDSGLSGLGSSPGWGHWVVHNLPAKFRA